MSAERDLATAIHHELTAPGHVQHGLDLWRYAVREQPLWTERDRIRYVLAETSAMAINEVLARRLREAARTGPWDANTVSDADVAQARQTYRTIVAFGWDIFWKHDKPVPDDAWPIDIIAAAIAAARTGPWGDTVELTEPLTGDTKVVDTRTGRIVKTRRRRGEP